MSQVALGGWLIARFFLFAYDLSKSRARRRRAGDLLLLLGVFLLVTKTWIAAPYKVTSNSMRPTLEPGEIFIAIKRPTWNSAIINGDIVVLHRAGVGSQDLVKRVSGKAGDSITYSTDSLSINGQTAFWLAPLQHTYKHDRMGAPVPKTKTVPPSKIFVTGDNLPHSADSRSFGPIPEKQVLAKATLRIYPISRWSRL